MRVLALVKRISQQMIRDKRALALMMVAPLLILTLLDYLLTSETVTPKIGVAHVDDMLIEQLEEMDIAVLTYDDIEDKEQIIIDKELDGFLRMEDDNIQITLKNANPSTAKALQMKIQQAVAAVSAKEQANKLSLFIQQIQEKAPGNLIELEQGKALEIDTDYIYGKQDTTFFDQLSPILVGYFVFFFVFLISGIALLRERTTGTLDRLLATPIQRREIVFGYLLGYGLFAIIQTIIVVFYAVKVLDITLIGSLWHVILINLTIALVALSLGILLSAFANSEFQMMQFIPIAIIPQIFFAGIFPVEGMADWLQVIAKGMPMYYAGNALVDVMYKGLGISDIQYDLLILLGFAIVFILLNIVTLKKYRDI
ncbi:ABC-2 type transport system permease protein [Cytobacillus eiseniae]|uniref:ABC-2 type transport system permease protein n=1 Tax=Cytobacillus eiseniae TaxID=762947 RepID=A0ABS4RID6_9BACI|nr:ABC transporter permease [Cytobacillus eiseniae]MBP2242054.1 ABC-2 type transport system permease protein [Cytobacillus eiseniae]